MLNETQWRVLETLSDGPLDATALCERLSLSPATASTQLALLKARGLVSEHGAIQGKRGKPRMQQVLAGPWCDLRLVTDGHFVDSRFAPDSSTQMLLRCSLLPPDHRELIAAMLCTHFALRERCAIAYLSRPSPQILLLTEEVEKVRAEHSSIEFLGKRIAAWTHSPEEFAQGILDGDRYFLDLWQDHEPLYDPLHYFGRVKNRLNGGGDS